MEFGLIVSIVAAMTIAPYLNPWTAPVAFALDAYNIYRYLDTYLYEPYFPARVLNFFP